MKNTRASRFVAFALSLALPGCAAQFGVSAVATPAHARTNASVNAHANASVNANANVAVDVDPRVAAAGALLGAGIVLASRAAAGGSHPSVNASSGGERGGRVQGNGFVMVSVDTFTLVSDAGDARLAVHGGTVQLFAPGASGEARVAGGTVFAAPASGGGWTLTGGSVVFADGSARAVSGGSLVLAGGEGTGGAVARGEVDAGGVVGAGAVVRHVGVEGAGEGVAAVEGGSVVIEGLGGARGGLVVVDGEVQVAEGVGGVGGVGGDGRWGARGGRVLVEDGSGRRFRCEVRGGWLRARAPGEEVGAGAGVGMGTGTAGARGRGRGWVFAGGEVSVRVLAAGDVSLALNDALGGGEGDRERAGGSVQLDAGVLAALDVLMTAAPPGSRDALRAAAAVQTVIHDAESTDANLYGVPVVGSPVVLVLDVSYSMSEPDPHGVEQALDPRALPSKLDVARAEAVKLLAEMPAGAAVDVVAFSTAVRMLWPTPRALDVAARDEAIRWLAALRPEDETHPLPAVRLAAEMQPGQLVLVGDGRPSDRDESNAGLLAVADALRGAGARMDVVGLGDDQDAAFLDQLAARGAGVARHR